MVDAAVESALAARTEAASQLRRLRDQIDEIMDLLESQAPCPQVMRRIFAAQETLQATQRRLLRHHLHVCLRGMEQLGDEAARQQCLAEVLELYSARPGITFTASS